MTNKYAGLLPCPFCGDIEPFTERADYSSSYVVCNNCLARGPVCCQDDDDEDEPGRDPDELWNTRPEAAEAISSLLKRVGELEGAGQNIIDRMFGTYRAGNGRQVSIEGDDGEKCWIVHSDDIEQLRAALNSDAPLSIGEI